MIGDTRCVYLTERACGPVPLGCSIEELACGDAALRLIRRGASAASGAA
ncbi:hypothetical protein [Infirmifilum sp. SLHALR2]